MLSSGMVSDFMRLRPRNSLAAMAAKISAKPLIILTVIAFNTLGDGLRDVLDPKLRK